MIKAIIFDFDDTLEKYKAAKHYAEKQISKHFYSNYKVKGVAKLLDNLDLHYTIKGRTKKDVGLYKRELWFKDIFGKLKIKPKKGEIRELVKLYWNSVEGKATLMSNTRDVLEKLKKRFKLAIISDSDGSRAIKIRRLEKLGITRLFDLIITGEDVKTTKPDKRFYSSVFRRLKVKSSECVMVGDKPEYDLQLAKKLGLKTVWFVYGDWAEHEKNKKFWYVDYKVKRLEQLLRII